MGRRRILIVDDEPALRESLAGWLERDGYKIEMASDRYRGNHPKGRGRF